MPQVMLQIVLHAGQDERMPGTTVRQSATFGPRPCSCPALLPAHHMPQSLDERINAIASQWVSWSTGYLIPTETSELMVRGETDGV